MKLVREWPLFGRPSAYPRWFSLGQADTMWRTYPWWAAEWRDEWSFNSILKEGIRLLRRFFFAFLPVDFCSGHVGRTCDFATDIGSSWPSVTSCNDEIYWVFGKLGSNVPLQASRIYARDRGTCCLTLRWGNQTQSEGQKETRESDPIQIPSRELTYRSTTNRTFESMIFGTSRLVGICWFQGMCNPAIWWGPSINKTWNSIKLLSLWTTCNMGVSQSILARKFGSQNFHPWKVPTIVFFICSSMSFTIFLSEGL